MFRQRCKQRLTVRYRLTYRPPPNHLATPTLLTHSAPLLAARAGIFVVMVMSAAVPESAHTRRHAAAARPLRRIWEGLVDFAANVLENKQEQQVAARVPFSGTIKDPHVDILATIGSVLHNAFVG